MAREPGYCKHKPTGQAYVNLGGKVIYLGMHGTEESKERYNRVKAEWLVNRHAAQFQPRQSDGPLVSDLCNAFLDHAEVYYPTSDELKLFKLAIQPLSALYPSLSTFSFGTTEFKVCRNWWLSDPKRSRVYVNKQMKRLIHIFKWGAGMDLGPASVVETLRCVPSLKRGRCDAPECDPVMPVSTDLVKATYPYLTSIVADMVRFQKLVGCRPGELVSISPAMVSRTSEVWTISLAKHKTAYRNKSRTLYIGPQAQVILAKYLLRASDTPCFSPIESDRERRQAQHEARATPLSCGNRPGTNRIARKPRRAPGLAFTSGTYARSILNACRRAKIECWSPNQLRHAAATSIRKEFGIEAAQVILGHSQIGVTQVYAERDSTKAIAVAKAVG